MANNILFKTSALTLLIAAVAVGCGGDDKEDKASGGVGSKCDPEAEESSCDEGLTCADNGEGNACVFPVGGACDNETKDLVNGGCAATAICQGGEADADTGDAGSKARCLVREGETCDPDDELCAEPFTCAAIQNAGHGCFGRLLFRGEVTASVDGAAIEGAQVFALNFQGVAVTNIAESDADGAYELEVPSTRNEDGSPTREAFTLRAAAQNFQPFPAGVRVALPISSDDVKKEGSHYILENALTDISLINLSEAERYAIEGHVKASAGDDARVTSEIGGVLVVATGPGGTFSGVSDKSGAFTIFNVPPGDYAIQGYAADLQLDTATATVGDEIVNDVDLVELADATTTVSGNVQIVNAPGDSITTVILVVEDTFEPDVARGEAPRGLRVDQVSGDFEIKGVPAGRYVVLAAYENDFLVRDPDTNIGGTGFVKVTVEGGQKEITLADSFKVTEALAIGSPGALRPEAVTKAPTLTWADDSSEDWYEVVVFDAFGNRVWSDENVPSVSGGDTVSLPYGGPLDAGMYYQFRVTSWRQPGGKEAAPISSTEDLRGVFFKPAP